VSAAAIDNVAGRTLTAKPIRPARPQKVQPVLLRWGLCRRPQTPPPETWPLDSIIRLRLAFIRLSQKIQVQVF